MAKKIKMLRDVLCRVNGAPRRFNKGQVYGGKISGWLPVDSYEEWERKPVVPTPNEIVVEYDG